MAKPGPERPHRLIDISHPKSQIQSGGTLERWTGASPWDLILSSDPITTLVTCLPRTVESAFPRRSINGLLSHRPPYLEAQHAEWFSGRFLGPVWGFLCLLTYAAGF